MDYQIITDGSCDLGEELAQKCGIQVVPFYVSFDDVTYEKEIEELDVRQFYRRMVDHPGSYPKSSMPNVQDYLEAFEPFACAGVPVICICITTKFSGSYASASAAGGILLEKYPHARIKVIDSGVNTVLQGMLVLEAVKMQRAGYLFQEAADKIEEIKGSGRIFFTIGSMEYLVHGGRVGKLMGLAGTTLGIKPLITLKEGEIFPSGITRSRRKSRKKVLDLVESHFRDTGENPEDYLMVIGYGYDYEEAVEFREEMLESISHYTSLKDVDIYQIGATIGVHTGPYPLGIGILKKAVKE
ncbi:DegV family protein [Lactonifactor longoviformis]|uniref:EDD domain protein, DegV family n=1 Tax=Lactonifactor longoviformis DSM 17459 TaxID=1122155 RepID=A0A1M4ZCE9_9CLOT|nr:DegV family protein [Lactonifactor longoviformis]POP34107.1 DegV family protein [Lactonifactor longoviformis]SHF15710.1 EDD domain protein, DegV family [Lactonifactor longoviformis DSM 17459]